MRLLAALCLVALSLTLPACATLNGATRAEQESVDRDIVRLRQLQRIAALIETYQDEVGHYPLANNEWRAFPLTVYLGPRDRREMHYRNATVEGVVIHPALFEKVLRDGLKKPVTLPHNPFTDQVPDATYRYQTVGPHYYLTVLTEHPLPFAKPLDNGRHGVSITSRPNAESAWRYESLTQYDPFILSIGAEPYNRQRVNHWLKQGTEPLPRPTPADRLTFAIITGDRNAFQAAMAEGVDINPTCPDHIPCLPLNLAARVGAPWMVQGLLASGADPNKADGHGDTPLLLANNHHNRDDAKAIITHLLNAGADPNQPNRWAWTPFAALAARGHVALMELALAKGADINLAAPAPGVDAIEQGDPPLIAAIRTGKVKAIKWLLDHGADPTVLGYDGMDARQVARAIKRPAIVRMLHPPPPADRQP